MIFCVQLMLFVVGLIEYDEGQANKAFFLLIPKVPEINHSIGQK